MLLHLFWISRIKSMQLLQKFLNKLNGLHFNQEYLCLDRSSFLKPIQAYLSIKNKGTKNITNTHLFLGYQPLVFGITEEKDTKELPSQIELIFTHEQFRQDEIVASNHILAYLSLSYFHSEDLEDVTIKFYCGNKGEHHFVSRFSQYIQGWVNTRYNRKEGNVFLENNLLRQVQIAYAVPRVISLITIGNGEIYNLFPTDLHGQISEQFYAISLRKGGRACEQVEMSRKVLLSEVDSMAYRAVYALGKNHMQPMKTSKHFQFQVAVSERLRLPLATGTMRYRELELIESFDKGIHRIHLFKIIFKKAIRESGNTLAHIHNAYATWRYHKGLPGNYLLR